MAGVLEGLSEFGMRSDTEPRVEPGDWVKVELRDGHKTEERFWCRVHEVRADGTLVAAVANDLLNSAHRVGDAVLLRSSNVLDVAREADRLAFVSEAAAMGLVEAAIAWHERRMAATGSKRSCHG